MKGNPLLRLGAVLLLLGVVLWPVWKITTRDRQLGHANPAPTEGTQASAPSTRTSSRTPSLRATLILHAAPPPLHCSIRQQDTLLLSEKEMVSPGEYRTAVDLAKGIDLVVAANWPDEELHAVRVEVYVHGYQAHLEKSFWTQGSLQDTLVLPDSFLP